MRPSKVRVVARTSASIGAVAFLGVKGRSTGTSTRENSGWTVLAAIKGDPALASIPVVLMSIVEEKNRGYALGAADYLIKPVDRGKLVETLTAICGQVGVYALLVDDDEVVRRSVRQALTPLGWQVTEAANGLLAVELLGLRVRT